LLEEQLSEKISRRILSGSKFPFSLAPRVETVQERPDRLRIAEDLALISVLKEPQRLVDKHIVILEDGAVSGIRENAELSIGQLAGQFHGIDCRRHDVVVAVNDQNGLLDGAERACSRHPPIFVIAVTWE